MKSSLSVFKIFSILLYILQVIRFALTATICYTCQSCLEPFDPLAYNVAIVQCPNGYDTCITNFIETEDGLKYSQRSCIPNYLCIPGIYIKNETDYHENHQNGSVKVTTKCCGTDLCINIHYFEFSITSGGVSTMRADVKMATTTITTTEDITSSPIITPLPVSSSPPSQFIYYFKRTFNLIVLISCFNYFVFNVFYL